jgi:hypothetical protein
MPTETISPAWVRPALPTGLHPSSMGAALAGRTGEE